MRWPRRPVVPPRSGSTETIQLFDGKSLNGWAGHFKHWSVDNGEIVGKNTLPVPVSTYLLTEKNYTDFRLTAKVKLVESEMHSGIAFWGRVATEQGDPVTYAGHLVMFPSGWGMYDLYGRNGLPVNPAPAKKVGKQHDWNDLEILALGNRVQVAVNGAPGHRLVRSRAEPDQGRPDRPPAPLEQGAAGSPVQGLGHRDLSQGAAATHREVNTARQRRPLFSVLIQREWRER